MYINYINNRMRKLNKKGLKQQGGATQEQMMQQQMMQQQQAQQQAQQQQPSLPEMIQTAMQEDGLTIEQVVEELKFNGVEDKMIFNALSQLGYKQQEIIPLLQPQQQKTIDMNEAFKMQQEVPKAQLGLNDFVKDFRNEDKPISSINTVPGAFESIFKGLNQMGLGLNIGKKNKFINQEFQAFQDDPSGYALENTYIGYDPGTGFNALMANPAFMTPEQRDYFIKRGKKLKDLSMTYASLPSGKTTITSPDLAMMSGYGRGAFNPGNFGTATDQSAAGAGNPKYEHGSDEGLSEEQIEEKNEINAVSSDPQISNNQPSVQNAKQRLYDLKEFVKSKKGASSVDPTTGKIGSGRPLIDPNEQYANTPRNERDYGSNKYLKEKILRTENYTDILDRYRQEIYPEVSLPLLQAMILIESGGVNTASSGAAGGLGQVVPNTWKERNKERKAAGLKEYDYNQYVYDPEVNIPYAIMTLKSKAKRLGITPDDPNFLEVVVPAYNAGEGIIKNAIKYAKKAGSKNPTKDWAKQENLLKAVGDYSTWEYYYKNKQGRKRNKFIDQKTGKPIVVKDKKGKVIGNKSKEAEQEAKRLKFKEISGYVPRVREALPFFKKYYGTQPEKKQFGGENDLPVSLQYNGRYADPSELQNNQRITPVDSPTGMYPGDLFFDYMTNIGQYNTPIDIALDPTVQISKRTPFGPEEADYEDLETEATMQDLQQNIGSYMDFADDLEQSNLYTKMGRQPSTGADIPTQKIQKPKEFDLRRFAAFSEGLVNTAAGINTLFDLNRQREASNLYAMSMADNMALLDRVPSRGYYAVNPGYLQPDFKASNFPTYNPAQTVQEGAELPVYQSQGGFEDTISQFPYVVSETDPLRLKETDEDITVSLTPKTQRFVDRKQKQFQRYNQDLSDFLSFMDGAKLAYKPTIAPYDAMTEKLQREGKMKVFDQPMVSFANDDVRDVGSFFDAMYSGIVPSEVTVNLSPKDKKRIRQKLRGFRQAARRLKKRQGGMTLDVNSDMIAKLIAAGANIEML